MSVNINTTICCPACGKKKTWTPENADRPFCSSRCKLMDLGEWASEAYCVPGTPAAIENSDELDDSSTSIK